MQTIVGIFQSRASAEEAVRGLVNRGIKRDCIVFLSPEAGRTSPSIDTAEETLRQIPTTDAEGDGMGAGVGALMAGGAGAAAGLAGGSAIAAMLVPGIGTIFAVGLGAAALLGLGGAAAGAKAGDVAEHALDLGVPKDDVFFYRQLLRNGRSLVIANLESDDLAPAAKDALAEQGGENVDEARREWGRAA